jgi:hypothetical protein
MSDLRRAFGLLNSIRAGLQALELITERRLPLDVTSLRDLLHLEAEELAEVIESIVIDAPAQR